jgi:hypothetical protein
MGVVAREPERGDWVPAPSGMQPAVCCDVIDLGLVKDERWKKTVHKVKLVWQLAATREDGKRHMVSNIYTVSLSPKAWLRKHLESWRGGPLTPEERKGFDLEILRGRNCILNIIHNPKTYDGEEVIFANVVGVNPLMKGMERITVEGYTPVADRDEQTSFDTDAMDAETEVQEHPAEEENFDFDAMEF